MSIISNGLNFFKEHKDAFIAIGVFISALVSLFAAYLVSRAQRKNVVGQLRAQWVEDLRQDVAEYIYTAVRIIADPEEKEAKESYNKLYNKIRLRLNENEKNHEKIVSKMSEIGIAIEEKHSPDNLKSLTDCLRKDTQVVLREEWKRAAKGKI